MQPDKIRDIIDNLPQIPRECPDETADEMMWEGEDGEAYLAVGKHAAPKQLGKSHVIIVTVGGSDRERERVCSEFGEVLGRPATRDSATEEGETIERFAWLVGSVAN